MSYKSEDLLVKLYEMKNSNKEITLILEDKQRVSFTYEQIWVRSGYIASKLRQRGAKKGSEVFIRCENLENYLYAFWGCVQNQSIAIPIDCTNRKNGNEIMQLVMQKTESAYMLYDNDDCIQSDHINAIDLRREKENLYFCHDDFGIAENLSMEDIVYILFSSGTTGDPNGVVISKRNISNSVQGIVDHYELTEEDRFLSWSPLSYCYGLIPFHIVPLFERANQCFMSTNLYMQSPLTWLDLVDEYRATRISSLPFAMRHFINIYNNQSDKHKWDLSCVKSMYVGGEQVNALLCKEFTDITEKYHLSYDKVYPVYGLSEATMFCVGNALGITAQSYVLESDSLEIGRKIKCKVASDSEEKEIFMEMGKKLSTVEIKICGKHGEDLPQDYLGYVYVGGPCITSGYYKNEKRTKEILKDGKWLCTGDVGFMHKDSLVIVGREKELIVSNGKKYTCSTIENIINFLDKTRPYGVGVVCNGNKNKNESEKVIVFFEKTLDFADEKSIKDFVAYGEKVKVAVYESIGLMIDEVLVTEQIPRTSSGKIFRRKMAQDYSTGKYIKLMEKVTNMNTKKDDLMLMDNRQKEYTKDLVAVKIADILNKLFHVEITNFDMSFTECGIISINVPPFVERINEEFQVDIQVSAIFSYSSVAKLAQYVYVTMYNLDKNIDEYQDKEMEDDKIAIIGLSCRFPAGSNNIDAFWETLMTGRDGIVDIPKSRWDVDKYYSEDENEAGKMYCKRGGYLDYDINAFDASLFNISPQEAQYLDPQQRLLLELVWEAFENAGMDIAKYYGSEIGVYLGISSNEYSLAGIYSGDLSTIGPYSITGGSFSTICGRVSYLFGFEGPCFSVDTACSSGLTALHLACNAVKAGETNMAVVAGVNLLLSPAINVAFSKLHATSKDGTSKSFDDSANGYGRAEGGGVLLIKKLSDAIRDKDEILGVIAGTGINQDGRSNGLTAPNGASQAKLMKKVLCNSNLKSDDIDYIEMHGTGTPLGDPIEINAVAEVYGADRTRPLKIGSVKSNIGHLEPAAGIASIIKVLLSLRNGVIPANLHFNKPNSYIQWDKIPIQVVDEKVEWPKSDKVRCAAINGFGFGGSNAHIIIEEYCEKNECISEKTEESLKDGLDYILKISAKNQKSLRNYMFSYVTSLEKCKDDDFVDLLYTANRGRVDFNYRVVITAKNRMEMADKLKALLIGGAPAGVYYNYGNQTEFVKKRKVAMLFTGQGSQYIDMGRKLYETNLVFKESMIRCDKLFRPFLLKSIVQMIYSETDEEMIARTVYAQPLIFSINYALYKLWNSLGVKPEIVTGHSIGEYVAAVVSNILSLEDAVKMVAIRGRLMDSAPGNGSMGTVFSDEKTVASLMQDVQERVSIAAHNESNNYVVSGERDAVETILTKAEEMGIRVKRLKVSHAFHSLLMNPILDEYRDYIGEVSFKEAQCRYLSCLYARELNKGEILDVDYWTKHVRDSVRFYDAINSIENKEEYAFLEVGSTRVLSALCKMNLSENITVVASLKRGEDDATQITCAIAELYVSGVDFDWETIQYLGKDRWKRVSLPNYPYDKELYGMPLYYDRSGNQEVVAKVHPLLGERIESPQFDNMVIFQRKFKADEPFFMSEHIIFEVPISPAAAHMSFILSAVKEVKNPVSCTIKSVEFRIPLAVVADTERIVQVCLKETDSENLEFEIVSRDVDRNTEWQTHATGKVEIRYSKGTTERTYTYDEMNEWELDKVTPEEGTYRLMRETGFHLGDGFRRITKVAHVPGSIEEYISEIEPLDNVPNRKDYVMYPGTIDSIFQTGIYKEVAKHLQGTELVVMDKEQNMIPYYMEELTYNYEESEKLLAYTSIIDTDNHFITFNVDVFNEKRELVLKLRKLMAKVTNRVDLLSGIQNMNMPFYYASTWVEKDEVNELSQNTTEKYIVVAENSKEAEPFVVAFDKYAIQVGIVVNGEETNTDNNKYVINQADPQSWKDLVDEIVKTDAAEKVVFIYCKGCEDSRVDGKAVSDAPLKGLLYLSKAMIESGDSQKIGLKIITKNAEVPAEDEVCNLNQATIWGLSKVLGIEMSNIYQGIIDIGEESLFETEFVNEVMGKSNDEVSLFNGKRYVQRVVKTSLKKEEANVLKIKEDASYLITGGTGAVGMVYVETLIELGAKKMLLSCRKQPSELVLQKIEEYKKNGVQIELVFADVSDEDSTRSAFAAISKEMLPIAGIIHAAGVLEDKMLTDQTWESFEKVLNPKVMGAVHVIENINKEALDFIIFVSSITSMIGNIGQSNYAAANYFMNQYAITLRNSGIPAYAVCWGPWQTGGMANSNKNIAKNMDAMGLSPISNEVGKNLIQQFLEKPENKLIIADIDWKKMSDSLKGDRQVALLESLVQRSVQMTESSQEIDKIYEELNQMESKEERIDYVCLVLQKICGSIMGFSKYDQLDVNSTLGEQGADSLIMFTMRSAINKILKIEIEVSTFYNYPTLALLAVYLVEEVLNLNMLSVDDEQEEQEMEDVLDEIGKLLV